MTPATNVKRTKSQACPPTSQARDLASGVWSEWNRSHLWAHGVWALSNRWDIGLRGDTGGFGISSEFTYQLLAVFHWEISETVSIPFGY